MTKGLLQSRLSKLLVKSVFKNSAQNVEKYKEFRRVYQKTVKQQRTDSIKHNYKSMQKMEGKFGRLLMRSQKEKA